MATVKLQDREIKKLKITVTNIKSVLLEKQKELKKVKLSKKRLDNAALQLVRKEAKEKSVEAVKKSSPLTSFSKKTGNQGGNIIDKIKSFGMIMLGGILVNALPGFIKKFNEIWDSIKPVIKTLNSAIKNMFDFFDGITESIQKFLGVSDVDKEKINSAKKEIEKDLKELKKDSDVDVVDTKKGEVEGEEPPEPILDREEGDPGERIAPKMRRDEVITSPPDKVEDIIKLVEPNANVSTQQKAKFKRINKNQDLAKLNQRTSTGHKTVIVQRQVVEVPVPV